MQKTPDQETILVECADCNDNEVEITQEILDMCIANAVPVRCYECHFKFEMAQVKATSDFKFGV